MQTPLRAFKVAAHTLKRVGSRGPSPRSARGTPRSGRPVVCRLEAKDLIEDGFHDEGAPGSRFAFDSQGGVSGSPLDAAIIVDRRADSTLADFAERMSKKLQRASDAVTRVMVASLLVSEALGRSGEHAANVRQRCERLVLERASSSGAVYLGDVMRCEDTFGSSGCAGGRQPGAGCARHRALLLKAVCDWFSVAPCAYHCGGGGIGWNVVTVDGEVFVVDIVFDPGALYEQGSGRAAEYIRQVQAGYKGFAADPLQTTNTGASFGGSILGSGTGTSTPSRLKRSWSGFSLASNSSAATAATAGTGTPMPTPSGSNAPAMACSSPSGTSPAAPSLQQHLGGHMVRPSWHVEPWEVEFDRRDRAGRGGFGEVFQGIWAGQPVAVKEVRDANPTDNDICDFILEISLLSGLSHPNVVRFWRGCVDMRGGRRTLLLVTEWMDRGVLSALLHDSQESDLTPGQVFVLATGIGRGVAYLHQVKILHLDLKSPNVLLNSVWQPKLCDFGLAKLREQTTLQTTLRGVSPIWAPPEAFDDSLGGVTEKSDVYSFGIIVYEIASRSLPFSEVAPMQLPRVKARGQMPRFPETMGTDLSDLVRQCLAHKPPGRPGMAATIGKLKQLAKSRGVELQREQKRMEEHGLHFCGPAGSNPNVEQLRRATAEWKRAEQEVARLKGILQEEEEKVAAAERQAGDRQKMGGLEDSFCERHTQQAEDKFRCALCRKLFRGPEFVHKHIQEKHRDELQAFLASPPPPPAAAAIASPSASLLAISPEARRAAGGGAAFIGGRRPRGQAKTQRDLFYDEDVAEEASLLACHQEMDSQRRSFNQMLHDAAAAGDLSRMQQCLLQGGWELSQKDADGMTPLHLCAQEGHAQCVQYLLSNSSNVHAVNEAGFTPLHGAARQGHTNAGEFLLQSGAVVDSVGGAKMWTALHLSAMNGHREMCNALLLHRANVNMQDSNGESALHTAARFGDRELCEVILSWGADTTATDNEGWCALHEAARWGDGELVTIFLQRGADAFARSTEGETPLHVVPGGYAELEVVEVLLAWRSDINVRDYAGETPLHVAVRMGDTDFAGVLLGRSADANVSNHAGATPLDFAKRDDIRWLLRSYKAKKGTGAG